MFGERREVEGEERVGLKGREAAPSAAGQAVGISFQGAEGRVGDACCFGPASVFFACKSPVGGSVGGGFSKTLDVPFEGGAQLCGGTEPRERPGRSPDFHRESRSFYPIAKGP